MSQFIHGDAGKCGIPATPIADLAVTAFYRLAPRRRFGYLDYRKLVGGGELADGGE
jgi:hypothetical protein